MASPSRRLQTKPVITCFKSVLLIYTFIFWITGVILLAVGIWGKVSLENYFSLLNEKATNVPFVLIGTGTVIILLGTFGCFATCRASAWMLKLIKNSFKNNYEKALKQYNSTGDYRSHAVDKIQNTGCFIKVMTIIESEMGVVAGISFGVACFQYGVFERLCEFAVLM
ncbi:Tetraspanin-6 [Tupaia chinensis]|uniref:Tetraspanin-6 n=1 Tax=Tupaia chinensis TaxID=246437 RepID=L8Y9S3_TUPCH|nr:Tetraspanin-6 [Tupaia chinensis]